MWVALTRWYAAPAVNVNTAPPDDARPAHRRWSRCRARHIVAHLPQLSARLRRHGVQLSLDDFGTGHSSLAVLQLEAAEQALRLHELGYRLAQGYHFGRPMAAERFTALIEAGTEPARPAAAA
jgi:predicted signal transduction protein with EAL and GGDEF domain